MVIINIDYKNDILPWFYLNVSIHWNNVTFVLTNDESRGYEIGVYQNWSIY